jgi:pimeloyl-ACP methyl ester carboxylesterase
MATFVVAHGAWAGGWSWKKVRPLLRGRGHELFTPTHTGIGERSHLAAPSIGLGTHIQDLVAVIEYEDLQDVVLVGHSYGGIVATGVADRVPQRVARVVYLDAFVPRDGQSMFDLQPEEARVRMGEEARTVGAGWMIPPIALPPDMSEADLAWASPRMVMQPIMTFEEPIHLTGVWETLPRTYIYCTPPREGDIFGQFAIRARNEPGWTYREIAASHNAQITAPEALAALLDNVAAAPAGLRNG